MLLPLPPALLLPTPLPRGLHRYRLPRTTLGIGPIGHSFLEAHRMDAGDEQMVEDLNFDQFECMADPRCERPVLVREARLAARMVMDEDHCGGVVSKRSARDFPRMDFGVRQRAAEEFLECNGPILCVDEDAGEHF